MSCCGTGEQGGLMAAELCHPSELRFGFLSALGAEGPVPAAAQLLISPSFHISFPALFFL